MKDPFVVEDDVLLDLIDVGLVAAQAVVTSPDDRYPIEKFGPGEVP